MTFNQLRRKHNKQYPSKEGWIKLESGILPIRKLQGGSMKKLLLLCVALAAGPALAGEPVRAVSKDLGIAMDNARLAVEQAAVAHGTCVSEYPSIKKCEEGPQGYWQCTGIRANHKGSCASKPSDLDVVIKAAKGLTGPAAKAAVMAGGVPQ
ncbi:hypothetical protein ABIB42_004490 [Massilia sp. UYP32]|uniref:hypothetical protein n=1 Tax=Massilia sp. UYP32 TaxID=1756386 RepID=UPI003D1CFA55